MKWRLIDLRCKAVGDRLALGVVELEVLSRGDLSTMKTPIKPTYTWTSKVPQIMAAVNNTGIWAII